MNSVQVTHGQHSAASTDPPNKHVSVSIAHPNTSSTPGSPRGSSGAAGPVRQIGGHQPCAQQRCNDRHQPAPGAELHGTPAAPKHRKQAAVGRELQELGQHHAAVPHQGARHPRRAPEGRRLLQIRSSQQGEEQPVAQIGEEEQPAARIDGEERPAAQYRRRERR